VTFVKACEVLGVLPRYATWQQVRDIYKEQAKACHPDKRGGDRYDWDVLQEAYQALRLTFSVPKTCSTCNGEKAVMGKRFTLTRCPACDGKGELPPQCKGPTS
jgi:DnaJ-class molecular chaperone